MKRREILGWLVAAGLLVAVVWAYVPRNAPSEVITGAVRVVDGDSMHVGDTEIRLFGVDAFEGWQTCTQDGTAWECGEAASDELRRLTARGSIECVKKDVDIYGRTVAICRNGAVDLNAELARAGLALAYREYSSDYINEEDEARTARRGAWAGEFTAPWDARDGRDTTTKSQPNEGNGGASTCRGTGIKGNINDRGDHIYHEPGSRDYEATKINESKGERWFCTVDEAVDAGWRPPHG